MCPWSVNANGKGMGEEWDSGGYGGHVSGEAATEHTGCVALGELLSARERERERAREREI